jgi:WhiB family redox-sensing transcriptional regulator
LALTMPKYDPSDHDWRLNAACKDTDPSLFFPIGTTGLAINQIDAAKQVCTTCPCMTDCLQFALDTNQDAGVWGGLGEEERRVIRRQRAAARRSARLAAVEAQAGL